MGIWTELALKLAQAKRLGESAAADLALRELSVLVTQTARRIHASYGSLRKQRAADFVAQAPTFIWNKVERFEEWYARGFLSRRPGPGGKGVLCRLVLRRAALSLSRQRPRTSR